MQLINFVVTHWPCGSSTSHEIAHARADERLNRRRWPWERIVNGEFDDVIDANDESLQFGDKEQFDRYT